MNSRFELNPGTKLALMKSLPSSSSAPDNFTLLWSYGRMLVNLQKEVVLEVLKQYVQEKPVFRTIHGQICCSTKLVPAHVFELLVLLAEPEVRVGGHDPVVLGEILQLHRPRGLDHRIRETDKVCRVVSTNTMMAARLCTGSTVELAEHNEGKEDKDEDDDGNGDPDQDGRVVRVRADPLAPSCLGEFVAGCVSAHLGWEVVGVIFLFCMLRTTHLEPVDRSWLQSSIASSVLICAVLRSHGEVLRSHRAVVERVVRLDHLWRQCEVSDGVESAGGVGKRYSILPGTEATQRTFERLSIQEGTDRPQCASCCLPPQ